MKEERRRRPLATTPHTRAAPTLQTHAQVGTHLKDTPTLTCSAWALQQSPACFRPSAAGPLVQKVLLNIPRPSTWSTGNEAGRALNTRRTLKTSHDRGLSGDSLAEPGESCRNKTAGCSGHRRQADKPHPPLTRRPLEGSSLQRKEAGVQSHPCHAVKDSLLPLPS